MRLIITHNIENAANKYSNQNSHDVFLMTNFADKFKNSRTDAFIPADFLQDSDFENIKKETADYLAKLQTGVCSRNSDIFNVLYFEIALFLNEYISSLKCLENISRQYDITEIILDNDFRIAMREGEAKNSVFYSAAEIYAVENNIKYSKCAIKKEEQKNYSLHWTQLFLIILSPLFSIPVLRKIKKTKRAALGVLFSYDYARHQDFFYNYNNYLERQGLNPLNLALSKSFRSFFFNYYVLLKINIFQILEMLLAPRKKYNFDIISDDKLTHYIFSMPLQYQWESYIRKYSYIEKYFQYFGRNLKNKTSVEVVYTFTPYEKIYYSLYHLKKIQSGTHLHLLPHSAFINKNFGQYEIFDQIFTWGQAQKDFLKDQNIDEKKVRILSNEKYKLIEAAECRKKELLKKNGIKEGADIITIVTYPINSYGGVFEPYSCFSIPQYLEKLKELLNIPFEKLGFRVIIKSHPKYDLHEYYNSISSDSIIHRKDISISELSIISDAVIAIGFPSTAIYEALNPSKPFIYVNCGLNKEYMRQIEKLGVVVDDVSTIEEIIIKLKDTSYFKALKGKVKEGFKYCFNI